MTLYQRISPTYEAVKYEPGMEDGKFFGTDIPFVRTHTAIEGRPVKLILQNDSIILTNTATGERSVVSQEEFEREFRRVEG